MKCSRAAWVGLLLCLVFGISLRAEMPSLLADAIKRDREQEFHWAYTETVEVRNGKGKVHDTVVLRYDPSKPYSEQYAPVSVDGEAPPKSFIQECRQRGEDEARERQKQFEKGEDEKPPEIELGNEKGTVDFPAAALFEEDTTTTTFKIPIRPKEKDSHFPFESAQLLIKVDKTERALTGIRLTVSTPVRINLVARLKGVSVSGAFTKVADAYPPQLTRADIDANVKYLIGRSTAHVLVRRTEFKRVKPYDERFTVKMGPLKTLGF